MTSGGLQVATCSVSQLPPFLVSVVVVVVVVTNDKIKLLFKYSLCKSTIEAFRPLRLD